MGWWRQDEKGHSFAPVDPPDMWWGDGPADVMDSAIAAIAEDFQRDQGRRPTKAEVRAGLEFSLGGTEGEEV